MATGAADGFLRCGCISGFDSVVERRPYHKNCGCALHGKKNGSGCPMPGSGKGRGVSYPMRRSWSEGCLALISSAQTSPATSPAPAKGQMRRLSSSSSFCNDFEDECCEYWRCMF